MVKHILDDWGISGPKRSWWYKMQLFNPAHFAGNLLYFDLDVVIANQLNWIPNSAPIISGPLGTLDTCNAETL
jgi:hypothetical protein